MDVEKGSQSSLSSSDLVFPGIRNNPHECSSTSEGRKIQGIEFRE